MKERYEKLRRDVIECLAMLEALIDFGEGEDIEEGVWDAGETISSRTLTIVIKLIALLAQSQATRLLNSIRQILGDKSRGEVIREGIRLVIFGPPNAGKSTLLNYFGELAHVSRVMLMDS